MKKHLWALGLLLTLQTPTFAMGWFQPAPQSFEKLTSVEYFLRWDITDFEQRYSWGARLMAKLPELFIPPAHAELPPEYQKAFSLRVIPQHAQQRLKISYHEQMVTRDGTHKTKQFEASAEEYTTLKKLLSKPISCTHTVEPGWVGPAPELLQVNYQKAPKQPEHFIFAETRKTGGAGPSEEDYKRNTRRYLCNADLKRWLQKQQSIALKPSEKG